MTRFYLKINERLNVASMLSTIFRHPLLKRLMGDPELPSAFAQGDLIALPLLFKFLELRISLQCGSPNQTPFARAAIIL